jgi:hypothetical protein
MIALQDLPAAPQQPAGPSATSGVRLNMTYDHKQQSATFNVPEGAPSTQGQLLLAVQDHLTGIYGLNLNSGSAQAGLMGLPSLDAVVKTNAGGGVSQLALTLAGRWSQGNLTAALGLQQAAARQSSKAAFTLSDPVLLFSAVPAAFYVAMQTNVPSLGVSDAPATINLRPGGAAALTVSSCLCFVNSLLSSTQAFCPKMALSCMQAVCAVHTILAAS